MAPLYAARVSDLGPGDFVKVECIAGGHVTLIPSVGLTQGFGCRRICLSSISNPLLRCRDTIGGVRWR